MDSKLPKTERPTSVQEFEPLVETVQDEDCDTVILHLPGFRKEHLRVQLTRTRNLITSGARRLEQQNILSRFRKEFPVSTNVEANKITAKFEGNILFIRQPKLVTPVEGNQHAVPIPKPPIEPSSPQKAADEPQPDKKAEEQPQRTDTSNALDKEKDQGDAEKERAGSVANNSVYVGNPTEDGKMGTKESEKQASDSVNNATNMKWEAEDGGRKTLDNYRQSVGGLARKLMKPRKVMNFLVVVLMALVLGIYITNSWKTDETAEVEL